jgi:tRNA threonylcarbamoyladenosine biosynthesis protein TsaB
MSAMTEAPYNLAIETSGRTGSISLGRGGELLAGAVMPESVRRDHRVDLMPTIDQLCRAQGVAAAQIGEVYVSIGPGSFTGLRVAVTTAKMFALVGRCRVVAVPSLDVVAQNAPSPEVSPTTAPAALAVWLNMKKETAYAGVFHWEGGQWVRAGEPGQHTMAQLLAAAPRPLAILGEVLPAFVAPEGVTILPADLATARSEVVWRLGQQQAQAGAFVDPLALAPFYGRQPEAVELWDRRHHDPDPGVARNSTPGVVT